MSNSSIYALYRFKTEESLEGCASDLDKYIGRYSKLVMESRGLEDAVENARRLFNEATPMHKAEAEQALAEAQTNLQQYKENTSFVVPANLLVIQRGDRRPESLIYTPLFLRHCPDTESRATLMFDGGFGARPSYDIRFDFGCNDGWTLVEVTSMQSGIGVVARNSLIQFCDTVVLSAFGSSENNEARKRFDRPTYSEFSKVQGQNPVQTSASSSGGGGCFIATAVYGSYDCPQVWTLRRFRDYQLAQSKPGRVFIKAYYAVSPMVVKLFGNAKWFKKACRKPLNALVERCCKEGYSNAPYEDKSW